MDDHASPTPPAGPSGLDEIRTERLWLRRWRAEDRAPFAGLNADPEVMEFFPAPMSSAASDALADRIEAHFESHGFGLYAVQREGEFIGFTGLSTLPFSDDVEIGWRLARSAWGHGYATEAGLAVLAHAFTTFGLERVVSITSVRNVRSQRVMQRLGLRRDPADDFDHPSLPAGHPLRPHVLYAAAAAWWTPPGG